MLADRMQASLAVLRHGVQYFCTPPLEGPSGDSPKDIINIRYGMEYNSE
jgi:hypothetical protein